MSNRQLEINMAGVAVNGTVQSTAGDLEKLIWLARTELAQRFKQPYLNTEGMVAANTEVAKVYGTYHGMIWKRVKETQVPARPRTYAPDNELLFESGAGRKWDRILKMIQGGIGLEELVNRLDRENLRILEEEYPDWARAQGDNSADNAQAPALEELMTRRLLELWTPGEKAAFARCEEYKQGLYRANLSCLYATDFLTAGPILVEWDGATLQIPDLDGVFAPTMEGMQEVSRNASY